MNNMQLKGIWLLNAAYRYLADQLVTEDDNDRRLAIYKAKEIIERLIHSFC